MNTNQTTTATPQPAMGAPIYTNRVTLVGYLGKVLDTREGRAIFSLATKASWKPKDAAEWQEHTDWHRVVAWNGLAEAASKLNPGDYLIVEGELRSSSYEREVTGEGVTLNTPVTAWEIHARAVRKLERAAAKTKGRKGAKA